jgi:hypothetical protein
VQFGAVHAPFFSDDYLFLDQVRGHSLPAVLTARDPIGNFFRPVGRQMHFWALSHLVGERPGAFHAANLVLFLAALALFFGLARRLAGARAAWLATALMALHYAADVPVLWASGSQDLLAVVGALGALWLYSAGHRGWAAVPFALGLLAKETVAVLPLVAVAVDARPRVGWRAAARRAWPLYLVALGWALAWGATLRLRPGAMTDLHADPRAIPAALLHLVQVFLGLEWRAADPLRLRPLAIAAPLAVVLAALWWALGAGRKKAPAPGRQPTRPPRGARSARESRRAREAEPRRETHPARAGRPAAATRPPYHAALVGALWAGLGTLPAAAAAPIWSAYFYLFALCGAALAVGALLARAPRIVLLTVVALLALTSENARRLDEFATARGAWTTESHVNRFYLERAMVRLEGMLAEMRQARPTLPPRSTIFFGDVPTYVGWQTGNGPLVRWAYRDTTLRSYYLSALSPDKTRRGPLFFFMVFKDTLRDRTDNPRLFGSIAFAQMMEGHPQVSAEWLRLALERHPMDTFLSYLAGWTALANGDTAAAMAALQRAGVSPVPGPSPGLVEARRALAAHDTTGAVRILDETLRQHALDPAVHGLLVELILGWPHPTDAACVETYATTVLAPQQAEVWRRWAAVQLSDARYSASDRSLRRYFELAGPSGRQDAEALSVQRALQRMLPGGDVYQRGLRE